MRNIITISNFVNVNMSKAANAAGMVMAAKKMKEKDSSFGIEWI